MLCEDVGHKAADAAERLHGGWHAAQRRGRADVKRYHKLPAQLPEHRLQLLLRQDACQSPAQDPTLRI